MDKTQPGELTGVLAAIRDGDRQAESVLLDRVYHELRAMAHRQLRRERARSSLVQTTMLVNEAWLRLAGDGPADWKDRHYFFGAAAQAMRRVLVDYARKRRAARRGGGAVEVTLGGEIPAKAPAYDVLDLHESLEHLSEIRRRAAQVVELRFFGGLTVPETAKHLGISARSVDSDWNFARRWLERALSRDAVGRPERPDAT